MNLEEESFDTAINSSISAILFDRLYHSDMERVLDDLQSTGMHILAAFTMIMTRDIE